MQEPIQKTIDFVKRTLANAEAGHDWFHIERVFETAKTINQQENGNELVVAFAALLHDIADPKFNHGDEELGPNMAASFLESIAIDAETIKHVKLIIQNMSFKNSFDAAGFTSKEMQIVQDADRLDAIGAIGIARAFTYGGFKNRVLYDPAIAPEEHLTKESYKNTTAPTINHFYEKLLLLKDLMNTETGKTMATERHNFMLLYLDHFYKEWSGKQ
ncbi:HD domain-containing protein [Pedobacter sp. HDW13]|uniref:HD domain-containing protein n=1 Tax=unclassified Pedobacter TaxID=2628915 RepID=UPI000F5AD98F|nr:MULTISPECIES: HD domain-containing protein [unclassified Pedobacter]QIL39614.1 HD domain-containing protein [Pedobacter sp. HDW13]RQO78502.1 phosphohydrolase [Pedobacter sp. KBW01]